MKAIRVKEFGGPEVMRLEEIPDPKPSGAQVVVRSRAAGVNPVDAYIRSGVYPRKPALPYTPGTDGAGIVESAGPDARRFKAGDGVYLAGSLSGTYAQLALCEEQFVFPLPAQVSFAQGAAIHVPYVTAYRALFQRAHALAGTGGRGYDLILEMLANVNLGRDLTILAPHGRVSVVGSRGNAEITPRDMMGRDGAIFGMSLWNATPQEVTSIHAALIAGLENKSLRPVVSQEIPLAEAARAHTAIMAGGAYGKIVLVP